MKKVVFINIFSGYGGGGEIYLKRLIYGMHLHLTDSKLFLISPNCNALDDIPVEQKRIIGVSKQTNYHIVWELVKCISEINNILKNIHPDVLVINGDRAILMSPFIRYSKVKIGIKHMLINSWIKFLVNIIPFCCLDSIVTISKYHVTNYTSFLFGNYLYGKIRMIYNSVNLSFFSKMNIGTENEKISFIEIASLEKRKGQMDLLEAFKFLHMKYDNIRLDFIGIGRDKKLLANYVKKNGLSDSVFFHGFQSDIRPFLFRNSTVFVLPSYDEGLPITILETMSCEIPAISTNIAGIPEVIESGINGFLVSPGNVSQLITYMSFFIDNSGSVRSMGLAGRKKMMGVFDEDKWLEEWKTIL